MEFDHAQHQLGSLLALEVRAYCLASPGEYLPTVHSANAGWRHPDSLQPDDVGPQVGQHHRAERPGTEPSEFDDPESGKRSRCLSIPDATRFFRRTTVRWP